MELHADELKNQLKIQQKIQLKEIKRQQNRARYLKIKEQHRHQLQEAKRQMQELDTHFDIARIGFGLLSHFK